MKTFAIVISAINVIVGLVGMIWAYGFENATIPGLICSGAFVAGLLGLELLDN